MSSKGSLDDDNLPVRVRASLVKKTRRLFLMAERYRLKPSEVFRELSIAYKEVTDYPDGLVVLQIDYLIRQLERHEQLIDAQLGKRTKSDDEA
jgi:hypothetical protein